MEEQRRENFRTWFSGIILGVFGNFLVSAAVEITNSSGLKLYLWTVVFALSWILFMRTLSQSARMFDIPISTRRITIATYAFLVFIVVWTLFQYLVLHA